MEVRIGTVTGSRVAPNAEGTEPGRVLQVVVTDALDVQSVQTCQAGDEYNPPNGAVVLIGAGGSAYKLALALDDGIEPVMPPGGKRIYAVDAEGEAVTCEFRLYPDGTVVAQNGAASFTMSPEGVFAFSGISSEFDHPITAPDVIIGGIPHLAHTHISALPGSPTGVPQP